MSVVIETFLMCDGCACTFGVDMRHRKAYEHRDQAKREGWRLTKEGDFCPTCKSKKKVNSLNKI